MATPYVQYASAILLAIIPVVWFFGGKVRGEKIIRNVCTISGITVVGFLIYYSYLQYGIWQKNELSQFLLPPHRSISYFAVYVLTRFFMQYIVSAFVAAVFFIGARMYNKRHGDRFFYPEEPYFIALGVFLSGHPLWIVYLVAVVVVYALFSVLYRMVWAMKKRGEAEPRISFYYGWLPVALFVILLKSIFADWPVFALLMFDKNTFLL